MLEGGSGVRPQAASEEEKEEGKAAPRAEVGLAGGTPRGFTYL